MGVLLERVNIHLRSIFHYFLINLIDFNETNFENCKHMRMFHEQKQFGYYDIHFSTKSMLDTISTIIDLIVKNLNDASKMSNFL